MGLVLTLLYLGIAYVSPAEFGSWVAEYHIQQVIAAAALLVSLPHLQSLTLTRVPQLWLIAGLAAAVFMSVATNGWLGGGIWALHSFLANAIAFYLVVLNFRTLRRLRILAIVLLVIGICLLGEAAHAYYTGATDSPFLVKDNLSDGAFLIRIRALAFLNDPNDLAQFLIVLIPFLGLFWRPNSVLRNFLYIILPTGFLLFGIYLTHSRGAVVALAAVLVFSLKERLGATLSALLAGVSILAAVALDFTGGRAISVENGAERLDAWYSGFQFLKAHPLFGVGYGQFAELNPLTAHNSYLLTAAELGVFGYVFWTALLVCTMAALNELMRTLTHRQPETALAAAATASRSTGMGNAYRRPPDAASSDDAVLRRYATVIRLSLIGFLAGAWFLSRPYTMTLYLLIGMAVSLSNIAFDEREIELPGKVWIVRWTVATMVVSLLVINLAVRLQSF